MHMEATTMTAGTTELSIAAPPGRPWAPLVRWMSLLAYGALSGRLFGATTPPATMRRRFERFGAISRATMQKRHPEIVFADYHVGRLAIESVRAVASPSRVILYVHGGAYVMGSPASYRSHAARMSARCNAEVFVVDYRLAPEHPFPAALEDARAAWQYIKAIRRDQPAFVAGESSGGGLALSLLVRLRDGGDAPPTGAVLLSPLTDLSDGGAASRHRDLWLSREHVSRWASYYAGVADLRDPLVSPAFADLSSLPPLLVLAGEDELLAGDARRVADRARAAGTEANLWVGAGMQHAWPITLHWLEESRLAWEVIARFVAGDYGTTLM
jgi:acetyl esterase/lipase